LRPNCHRCRSIIGRVLLDELTFLVRPEQRARAARLFSGVIADSQASAPHRSAWQASASCGLAKQNTTKSLSSRHNEYVSGVTIGYRQRKISHHGSGGPASFPPEAPRDACLRSRSLRVISPMRRVIADARCPRLVDSKSRSALPARRCWRDRGPQSRGGTGRLRRCLCPEPARMGEHGQSLTMCSLTRTPDPVSCSGDASAAFGRLRRSWQSGDQVEGVENRGSSGLTTAQLLEP
jgi:hypothetical protein